MGVSMFLTGRGLPVVHTDLREHEYLLLSVFWYEERENSYDLRGLFRLVFLFFFFLFSCINAGDDDG